MGLKAVSPTWGRLMNRWLIWDDKPQPLHNSKAGTENGRIFPDLLRSSGDHKTLNSLHLTRHHLLWSRSELKLSRLLPALGKVHPACFRDFIFHLYELSNLVTITPPLVCKIVVLTSFHKMEVNIPERVGLLSVEGHTCQKSPALWYLSFILLS